jgi:serine protease Do
MAGAMLLGTGSRPVIAQNPAQITVEERSTASALEGAFMKVADMISPATVSITARVEQAASGASNPLEELLEGPGNNRAPRPPRVGTSVGSGVVVRPDGYILTNDHVVAGAKDNQVKVTFPDGTSYIGTVARDQRSDLAVVKINAPKPLPYVRLANSDSLHVGQWAIAIGSPFGQQNSMTTGIVSALHRKSTIGAGEESRYYPALIQTDAAINRGNSGGPLLNINGELIGINVAIYSPTGTSAGIGFAIPANTAQTVMEQLIAKGRVTRGSLGIVPDDIAPELRVALGTSKGAYVKTVAGGSPADKAGIEPGDVVTRFNDRAVNDEVALRDAIGSTAPGTQVPVVLLRDGKTVTVTATLEESKERQVTAQPTASPVRRTRNVFGFGVEPVTDVHRDQFGLPKNLQGLLVKEVQPGSPADDAGVVPGMVVTAANGQPLTTAEALNRVVVGAKSGSVVTLRCVLPAQAGTPSSRVALTITVP